MAASSDLGQDLTRQRYLTSEAALISAEFDGEFYLSAYPDVATAGVDPLAHYTEVGWREGRRPNSEFDPAYYLEVNPDVRSADINPFLHFMLFGRSEGRLPRRPENSHSTDGLPEVTSEAALISAEFDGEFYLSAYPDVATAGVDPLAHYTEVGWREGRRPNSEFDPAYYLEVNPDVRSADINPFLHFMLFGRSEGRLPRRPENSHSIDQPAMYAGMVAPTPTSNEWALVQANLDTEFYTTLYQDVAAEGIDPVTHYMLSGWKEGRRPTPEFDTAYYLSTYPDVKAAGLNPFYHYLVAGRPEGRLAERPFATERNLVRQAHAAKAVEHHQTHRGSVGVLSPVAVTRAFDVLIPKHRTVVVLSFSHDEYTRNYGGIQNCVGNEQHSFNREGATYVHLAPSRPMLRLDAEQDLSQIQVVATIDGERVGHVSGGDLIDYLEVRQHLTKLDVLMTVHSILGHSVALIRSAADRLKLRKSHIWLHDFSTLCLNYTLLRNDAEFCWAPPTESNSCQVCVYGSARQKHLESIGSLFAALRPTVLAPSEAAKQFWENNTPHVYQSIEVVPHGFPCITGSNKPINEPIVTLRIAFVGAPVAHKGWHIFSQLVTNRWRDHRYKFYLFASNPGVGAPGVEYVNCSVTPERRNAMVEALTDQKIDVVVNWSLCYETFSYSCYESVLAGAFVIAREDSGNIPVIISNLKAGKVVKDSSELIELFRSGELLDLVHAYRTHAVPTGYLEPHSAASRFLNCEEVE